ncbi:hypothetical protein SDC9_198596 [bioreactor metagenome]|uniref:Membrane transporter protein n=1 Tax=bioreactor metagenome TaxID=1076179 RepID=A0A645IIY9_9ZZZZ
MLPVMAVLLLANQNKNKKSVNPSPANTKSKFGPFRFFAFTLIGAYGGFTHAGVGILIIFGSVYLLGLDLIRANGIKQFAVVMYTPLALAVFIWYGQVNWPVAIIYAVGNVTGAVIASKVAVKWGAVFINYIIASAVFIMSFWLIYKQFI